MLKKKGMVLVLKEEISLKGETDKEMSQMISDGNECCEDHKKRIMCQIVTERYFRYSDQGGLLWYSDI